MILSDDLLWEMASLISNGGKPCFHHDFHFINQKPDLFKMKRSLLKIKKRFPHVRFYLFRINEQINTTNASSFMFLMYRYDFQKEIYKYRYSTKSFNKGLFDWSLAGLLYGYSPEEIQKSYDKNKEKFGEIFN